MNYLVISFQSEGTFELPNYYLFEHEIDAIECLEFEKIVNHNRAELKHLKVQPNFDLYKAVYHY